MEKVNTNKSAGKAIFNKSRPWQKIKKNKYLYIIFFIPLLYYIIFQYIPLYGVIIAFKDYNIIKGISGSEWVGFKYFREFLSDPYFWKLVRNTILISIYNLLWGFPVPIIFAILLNEVKNKKFKMMIQNAAYLPHFISTVVVCGMIVTFLASDGLITRIITAMGIHPKQYLMLPQYFRTIFISSGIWQSAGWNAIVYLAALSGVDESMYEAAAIDGANRLHRIWNITLPSILPTISILLILDLGRMMNVGYEKVMLLYNGSTYETADIISTYVYRRGILNSDFSYSTAVGLFQAVISVILLVSSNKISKKLSETSLW